MCSCRARRSWTNCSSVIIISQRHSVQAVCKLQYYCSIFAGMSSLLFSSFSFFTQTVDNDRLLNFACSPQTRAVLLRNNAGMISLSRNANCKQKPAFRSILSTLICCGSRGWAADACWRHKAVWKDDVLAYPPSSLFGFLISAGQCSQKPWLQTLRQSSWAPARCTEMTQIYERRVVVCTCTAADKQRPKIWM